MAKRRSYKLPEGVGGEGIDHVQRSGIGMGFDLSMVTLTAGRQWGHALDSLEENDVKTRTLYPATLLVECKGRLMTSDIQVFRKQLEEVAH